MNIYKPFFSVVIPALNEENFLPLLLEDLKKQKFKNFEVVIVDGSSTDETIKVAKYFDKNLNLKTFVVKKRNVSFQRNFGAEKSIGKYILFIDADTRIKSDFLLKANKIIQSKKYLILLPKFALTKKDPLANLFIMLSNYAIEISQITSKPFASGGNFIIYKDFFNHISGFNEKLYISEDHDIVTRAKKIGVTAIYCKNLLCEFSLRRLNKDGFIDLAKKYALSSIYRLIKGGVYKKIYNYEMGGARYIASEMNNKKINDYKVLYEKFIKLIEKL
jgi:glycosyltransferase involved in cell wall biosynthesis